MNRRISIQDRDVTPESFITKGKQRIKQHMDIVFLENGDEFEIELFNPTRNKVLAKIELNGNSIGSGLVLRPGERVFLERYIDTPKRFLFETYTVNGENQDVLTAIKNNGEVVVKFYKEFYLLPNFNSTSTKVNNVQIFPTTTQIGGTTIFNQTTNPYMDFHVSNTSSSSVDYSMTTSLKVQNEIETGRVEKGSDSNQSLGLDISSFDFNPSWYNRWSIKPLSQKPVTREDLVTYCVECGSRRKKDTFRYCPHCGNKF
jgi:hypothetical protein